ncbi:MAG: hypothetical protein ACI4EV_03005 [Lachnospiraceae bacterium]
MFSYREFWDALKVQAGSNKKFSNYFRGFMTKPSQEDVNCNLTTGAITLSLVTNMKAHYLQVQVLFANQDYVHCRYYLENLDLICHLFPGEAIETNRAISPTAFGIKYTDVFLTATNRWSEYFDFFINHAVLLQQLIDKCDCGYLKNEFPTEKFAKLLDELNEVEQPAEEQVEQEAEQPVEKEAEQSAEEPVEKEAEQPAEEYVEQEAEQPAEEQVEQEAEQPAEEQVEQEAAAGKEEQIVDVATQEEQNTEETDRTGKKKLFNLFGRKNKGEVRTIENDVTAEVQENVEATEEVSQDIAPATEEPAFDTAATEDEITPDVASLELQADINLLDELSRLDFKQVNEGFVYGGQPKQKGDALSNGLHRIYPRDVQVAVNALARAHFVCEIDEDHTTFIRRNSGKMYTEPLHLVPMSQSDNFDVSLDVEENIVSLCCNCCNQIKYGKSAESIIKKLYNARKEALEKAGIKITIEELLSMYGL